MATEIRLPCTGKTIRELLQKHCRNTGQPENPKTFGSFPEHIATMLIHAEMRISQSRTAIAFRDRDLYKPPLDTQAAESYPVHLRRSICVQYDTSSNTNLSRRAILSTTEPHRRYLSLRRLLSARHLRLCKPSKIYLLD